jgi:hypothetical protein
MRNSQVLSWLEWHCVCEKRRAWRNGVANAQWNARKVNQSRTPPEIAVQVDGQVIPVVIELPGEA